MHTFTFEHESNDIQFGDLCGLFLVQAECSKDEYKILSIECLDTEHIYKLSDFSKQEQGQIEKKAHEAWSDVDFDN